jgi:dTDP-3-amino-2,3,6-trideoxy-4-keto-D-glucose/dTDP-3-amino-3,4,6-trideoxy-alpha-D-glucose/dTDP-2,6-dideoxy-D-kanosamine transaminase
MLGSAALPFSMQPIPFNNLGALHAGRKAILRQVLDAVLDSGWYVLGPQLAAFEAAFADFCQQPHCIGVGNGSDALELALRALGVGAGDRVVTVANAGFYASGAILHCAAEPLYVDIDAERMLLDPAGLDAALMQAPRALIVTHLYGRLAEVELIVERCRAAGVAVVEDCAQAHGAERGGHRAGSFGDIGCFSFYPTKNLGALGDGGALVCRDPALAGRLRALRQYGWAEKYRISLPGGRNSRLDELQAALLAALLPQLPADNARRQAIARAYHEGIRHPALALPAAPGSDDVAHLYVLRSRRRDALRAHLGQCGIGTDVHYPLPDHLQPIRPAEGRPRLPETERAAGEILSLPCHPALADTEVQRVIDACNRFDG